MQRLRIEYLGDGLYVEDQGYQIRLFTEGEGGAIHEVYLDGGVLNDLFLFVEETRGVKITVERTDCS